MRRLAASIKLIATLRSLWTPVRTALAIALTVVWLLLLSGSPSTVHGGTNGLIFTVNTTADNDDGNDPTCSLREAIKASNIGANYNGCVGLNNPGTDANRIQFDLGAGNPVINVTDVFDSVLSTVVIDGATGGATRVVLHGPGDTTKASGLNIQVGANYSEVRKLVVNNFVDGYPISVSADNVTLAGNYIGTDAAGTAAIPNENGIILGGDGTRVGGTTAGAGNVISGNLKTGLEVRGSMSTIQGNFIGTNSGGMAALPNQTGISLSFGSNQSVVGGSSPGAGNLISGNLASGVLTMTTLGLAIEGNFIGTDVTGASPLPNGDAGILVGGTTQTSSIGGSSSDHGNVIAFNGSEGVRLGGMQTFYIQIRRNSIYSNGSKGIELDPGTNGDIIAPVVLFANPMGADGTAGTPHCVGSPCGVDIYSDSEDEGRTYEGSTMTDSIGNWTFDGPLAGPNITATVTDDGGDTSEFSAPFTLATTSPTPSPTPLPTPTPSVTPSPTPVATPTPTHTTGPLLGDADCDDDVDMNDMIAALSEAAEVDPGAPCAERGDTDCDDDIDAMDALRIASYVAGVPLTPTSGCGQVGT